MSMSVFKSLRFMLTSLIQLDKVRCHAEGEFDNKVKPVELHQFEHRQQEAINEFK